MTFRVNGIKQKQSDTTPIVLVVETDSELLVRKLLEKYTILVLSINEYKQDPKLFGDVWAKIKRGFDGITIVSEGNDVKKVCENLLDLGLDIAEINSYSNPLSTEAMQAIISNARTAIQMKQAMEMQSIQGKKDEKKKIYADPKLARAKVVVERIFERIPPLLESLKGQLESQDIKHITALQEDLKKLRMGNNYEKIRDLADEILDRMQHMEEVAITLHPEQAAEVIKDSVVTNQDIEKEEMKFLYTQQKKALGVKLSAIANDYAVFGELSLFWKFFQKDMRNLLSSPSVILYYLHDTALVCVGFLLSIAGSFIVYNLLRPTMNSLDTLRSQLIKRGTLGLLLWIGSFLKKKKIGNLILIYGLTLFMYRLVLWLITTNFALVI
ncbi:MAG: hypothetical protein NTX91_04755 [candidate division SR1 bacterium]|nr:hypothetical protein [candidate division SR1 bacterium]